MQKSKENFKTYSVGDKKLLSLNDLICEKVRLQKEYKLTGNAKTLSLLKECEKRIDEIEEDSKKGPIFLM